MNESNETRVLVSEEQIRLVLDLLKEYTDKLSSLNEKLLDALSDIAQCTTQKKAWLLDQGELLRKPLSEVISRGSAFLEHLNLDTTTEGELALRMREIEIQLHHTLRMSHELRQGIDQNKNLAAHIAKLRVSAGLNAMKGGPLRPE